MDKSWLHHRVIFLLWILSVISGENVQVHILRHTTTSKSCSFPPHLDVTILRHMDDDVTLSLKTNEIITVPRHVVLMTIDEASQGVKYQHVEVPGHQTQAYHSVEKGASFVVRCAEDDKSWSPVYIFEGTFFHDDSKFTLHAASDDVMVGPIDVTATYVMEKVEEHNSPQDHEFIDKLIVNRPPTSPDLERPHQSPPDPYQTLVTQPFGGPLISPPEPFIPEPDGPISPALDGPFSPIPDGPFSPVADEPPTPIPDGPLSPLPNGPLSPIPYGPLSPLPNGPLSPIPYGPLSPLPNGPLSPIPYGPLSPLPDGPLSPLPDGPITLIPDGPLSPLPNGPLSPILDGPISPLPDGPISPLPNGPLSPLPNGPLSQIIDTPFNQISDGPEPKRPPINPPEPEGLPHHSSRDRQARGGFRHRRKRAVTNYYIDVLPVIDFHLYTKWLLQNINDVSQTAGAITTYMTNVFTSMSLRIHTLSLENNVVLNIRMLPPHISTSPSTSAYSEDNKEPVKGGGFTINVIKQLNSFRDWLGNSTDLPDNDHAMLFTGYDVYGGADGEVGNNLTRGLAFVGGICGRDGYSSSVVQDQMAYQSEPVAVHELGHSLGSKHDGDTNACDSLDRYIMSDGSYPQGPSNVLNPFSFSQCSSAQISAKIGQLEATSSKTICLTSKTGSDLPGVAPLDAKEQCQALFGVQSFVCRGSGVPDLSQVCVSLFCSIPGSGFCRQLMAATGTCCGNGKYCIEGACTAAPSGQCAMNEECLLEDQPGSIVEGKTCAELDAAYCYEEDVYKRCCRTCQKYKTGTQGCDFGDKAPGCVNTNCGSTLQNGLKYNFFCCKTCSHTGCQDRSGFLFRGSTYTCPAFVSTFGKHYCYFQQIHDTQCCMTCENNRSPDNACPYGDFLHLYNCKAIVGLGRACTEKEKGLCCETCKTITIPETTAAPSVVDESTEAPTQNPADGESSTQSCTGSSCSTAGRSFSVPTHAIFVFTFFVFRILS